MEEFAGVPIEPVQRKYWNDIAGDEHSAFFFGCVQS
jgi:hypothetical protein